MNFSDGDTVKVSIARNDGSVRSKVIGKDRVAEFISYGWVEGDLEAKVKVAEVTPVAAPVKRRQRRL